MKSDFSSFKATGKISEYDDLVKKYSKTVNWDWRLVSSIVYQESRFDHSAKSWVGAGGLMQLMPSTARELSMRNHSVGENIRVGVKYLNIIYKGLITYLIQYKESSLHLLLITVAMNMF